ncbi:MAG: PAS domain-containing protein [Anaerolineales bacterium]|nr:PAS domain-containing protein [Anaerolineales bacterium]
MRARLMIVSMMVYAALFVILYYGVSHFAGVLWATNWANVPPDLVAQIQQSARLLVGMIFLLVLPFWIVGAMFLTSKFTKPFAEMGESAKKIEISGGREEINLVELESAFTSTEEIQRIKNMLAVMYNTIRENDELFRSIVSNQRELIFRWKPDFSLTFVNQAFCEFFDRSEQFLLSAPGELLRKELTDFYPELARIIETDILVRLEKDENEIVNETFLTMPDGATQWVQWRSMAIFNENGNIIECQTIGYVLTDLKRTQLKLEEANYQLASLSRELIKNQEEERIRVARYLHDQVLGELGEMARKPDNSLDQDTINQVIDKLRTTIYRMRSPMLNYGLSMALEDLADHMQEQAAQAGDVKFLYLVEKSLVRFDRQVETQIYRIVQEASKNALEHANAREIRIVGQIREGLIDLAIEDDGSGFHFNRNKDGAFAASRHYGMVGMEERCKIIGAQFDIRTKIGKGTIVRVKWTPDMVPEMPENGGTLPIGLPKV